MELSPGPSGFGLESSRHATVLTARQVARQLGHSLAALDNSLADEPMVGCSYSEGHPELDSVMLTYAEPTVCVETALRARIPQRLDEAARGALTGFWLNAELQAGVPRDIDAWMRRVLDKSATLQCRGDAAAVTIDGTPVARVVVDDGTYQAWALETDRVRVTVASRREHLESVLLRWWQPARVG